jgi:hypothetical protein
LLIRFSPVVLLTYLCLSSLLLTLSPALFPAMAQHAEHITLAPEGQHQHQSSPATHWEGSPAGIAYSEFNHHLSSIFVLVIGIAELLRALGVIRVGFFLPIAMFLTGAFLLIWSDHEAWPIGSLNFVQTFFGGDREIMQHKLFGILPMGVGIVEGLRRLGWLQYPGWKLPLPAFAIIGGYLLLLHHHGDHPGADKIAMHHAIMALVAVTAGSSKLAADWRADSNATSPKRWEVLWSALVIVIGLQLLIYSE